MRREGDTLYKSNVIHIQVICSFPSLPFQIHCFNPHPAVKHAMRPHSALGLRSAFFNVSVNVAHLLHLNLPCLANASVQHHLHCSQLRHALSSHWIPHDHSRKHWNFDNFLLAFSPFLLTSHANVPAAIFLD
jgi:hypothetical protein